MCQCGCASKPAATQAEETVKYYCMQCNAIKEAKAGRVEYRLDKTNNIHVSIGKASFDAVKLLENYAALMDAISKSRPSGAKGNFIKHITIASTMGPGIKVDPNEHVKGVE